MKFITGLGIGYLALIAAAFAGYVMNIIQLISTADGGFTTMFVLRIVGVIAAPLGAVLGFF